MIDDPFYSPLRRTRNGAAALMRGLVAAGGIAVATAVIPEGTSAQDVLVWGERGSGPGQFDYPMDLAVSPAGEIWILDTGNDRLQIYSGDGAFLRAIPFVVPAPDYGGAADFALSGDGGFYLAHWTGVARYDAEGILLHSWGSEGSGPGQFDLPTSLARDASGWIYVADSRNHRIQKFDGAGTFVAQWPLEELSYDWTVDIIAAPSGDLIVISREAAGRFRIFSPDGTLRDTWTLPPEPGVLYYAKAGAVGPEGELYMTTNWNHMLRYTLAGLQTRRWSAGVTPEVVLDFPQGIAVDHRGYVFVTDTRNNRIVRFHESLVPVRPVSWGRLKLDFRRP